MARFTLRDEGEWGNQGVRYSDGHRLFLFPGKTIAIGKVLKLVE